MSDLLFIRHAETDFAGRFCGHSDPTVNAAGRRQIRHLLEELRSEPFCAVYSSDLQRASTTATALATLMEVPLVIRKSLREIDFGRWEGLAWKQIEELDPSYATHWLRQFPNVPAPGGEPFAHFQARAKREIEWLRNKSRTASLTLAVVTHGGVLRAAMQQLGGIDRSKAWDMTRAYCSMFRYVEPKPEFPDGLKR